MTRLKEGVRDANMWRSEVERLQGKARELEALKKGG